MSPSRLSAGMTSGSPVDATSTCSGAQPTRRAASSAMARATAIPSSPVQAFAQPLLTMTARAWPPDRVRCSRDLRLKELMDTQILETISAGIIPVHQ